MTRLMCQKFTLFQLLVLSDSVRVYLMLNDENENDVAVDLKHFSKHFSKHRLTSVLFANFILTVIFYSTLE